MTFKHHRDTPSVHPSIWCLALVVWTPVGLSGCGDGGEITELTEPRTPPRAAAVSVSPKSAELAFIGATATFVATVTDQYGAAFSGTVAWTSDAPSVFNVSMNGVVTAASNGSGTVRASINGLSDTASVRVNQLPAAISLEAGDDQEAVPGVALRDPIVVRVLDHGGAAVQGRTVAFVPSADHGSVDPDSVTTDPNGNAATVWTLGQKVGPQLLTASVSDGVRVRVTANATTGHAIEIASGDRQRALPGEQLPEPVVIRVLNGKGEPFEGTTVVFRPREGHGSVTPDSAKTDSDGEAATIWTLGNSAGGQTLTASVNAGPTAELTASGLTGLGVCDRTPQVRQVIMWVTGRQDCAAVTEHQLSLVTSLHGDLRGSGINNLYHDDFAGLSNLDSLHLSYNPLNELPSGLFDGLSNLRRLSLANNRLTDLPSGAFDDLSSLEWLSLGKNKLESLPPGVFDDLFNLEWLNLGYNKLESLPPGVFDNLFNLEWLSLYRNTLKTLPSRVFQYLSRLPSLSLASNDLVELPLSAFAGLSSLRRLSLDDNSLKSVSNNVFSGLSELNTLHMTGNPIEHIDLGTFVDLPNLDTLHLQTVEFYTASAHFDDLSTMKSLRLTHDRGIDLSAGAFSTLRELELLRLSTDGQLTVSDGAFAELTQLRYLDVSTNRQLTLSDRAFVGLSALTRLNLKASSIPRLLSGVFEELGDLRGLGIYRTGGCSPSTQPIEISGGFLSGLRNLVSLSTTCFPLTGLPHGAFVDLQALETLWLHDSQIPELPDGLFANSPKLRDVWIRNSRFVYLPEGIFSGLSNMWYLWIENGLLSELPPGLFAGLANMESVNLSGHTGSSFPLTVSVERTDTTDLSAPGPATLVVKVTEGAPFDVVVDLTMTGGSLSATTVTIAAGSVRSESITATRSDGSQGSVQVSINGPPTVPNTRCIANEPCWRGFYFVAGTPVTLFR